MPLCTRLPSFYFRLPEEHLQFGEEQDQAQSQQLNTDQRKGVEDVSRENIGYHHPFYLIPGRVPCSLVAHSSRRTLAMSATGLIQWFLTICRKDHERAFCAMGQGEWSFAGLGCAAADFVFLLRVFDAEWLIAANDDF